MSSLSQIIETAKARNATGLLIHPGISPRVRVGQEWVKTEIEPFSSVQSQQLFLSWLSEDERKSIQENRIIEGVKVLGNIQFQFSFFLDMEGVKGSLYWKNKKATNNEWWTFPDLAVDILNRPQGIVLVCGLRRSGKTSVVQSLLTALSKKSKKSIFVISDFDDWVLDLNNSNSNNSMLISRFPSSYFLSSSSGFSSQFPPTEADVVIIDSRHPEFASKALRWAEDGRLVVLTMTSSSLNTGVERFMYQCEGCQETNWKRLALQFKMGLGLRLIPGVELPLVGAYELTLGSPEVVDSIRKGNMDLFNQTTRNSQEKTIMCSLNQALFQLALKRQIEFKMAFENSNDPAELDQLFRKVGV